MHSIVSIITAFLATIISIILLIPIAKKLGWVDKPCSRKQHLKLVPHIGGLCMFIGITFASLTQNLFMADYREYIAACALLIFSGIADDTYNLSPVTRIIIQFIAAIFMTSWAYIHLLNFGNILGTGDIYLYNWGIPLSILVVIGFINAMNMLDGLDGLAGGITLCILASMLILSAISQHSPSASLMLALIIAAVIAFLLFNARLPWQDHAIIFMGDAGSTFLGFTIVWFSIELTQRTPVAFYPVTVLWLLAIPLYDFISVILKRCLQRKSPLAADRQHLHHLLLDHGLSHAQTSYLIIGLTALFCVVGILLQIFHVPAFISFYSVICIFIVYLVITSYLHIRNPIKSHK